MARGNGKSGGNDEDDDDALWERVTKTVTPIKRTRYTERVQAPKPPKPKVPPPAAAKKVSQKPVQPRPAAARRAPDPPQPPALSQFDRRTRQKFTRGNVEIDARLDLHGHSAERARGELMRFISSAHAQGLRTVLVITGKGESPYARHTLHGADHFHTPERQGRLRRLIPEWLEEASLRAYVSGYQPAHPRHGGGGAFYVRLRRNRR
ncbi:MAG: Smr/MutS family protein [Pseudomonadota bacterium]